MDTATMNTITIDTVTVNAVTTQVVTRRIQMKIKISTSFFANLFETYLDKIFKM